MAYANVNFKTKKELKQAIADGKLVGIYNPSGFYPTKDDGTEFVEGPHYPQPHKWYAAVEMRAGYIVKVK